MARVDRSKVRKPDFFIVGAPRCGTTAMYEYLRQHPEIYMPEWKEPHFFGSDLTVTPRFLYYTPDIDRYLALFTDAHDKKRVGEASTMYLKSQRAASEIKEFSPSARILIMLRNPVDMIHSLHSHVFYEGTEDIEDFESALEAEEDRKLGLRIPKGCGLLDALFYREVARFSEQVQLYFTAFGPENVHVVYYDDFRDNTDEVFRATLRFLDVCPDFQPRFEVVYGNRQVRKKLLRVLYVNRPVWLQRALMDGVPPWLTRTMQTSVKWLYSKPAPRPSMNANLRSRLQAEFQPEVERLSKLLGRDFTHWSKE
jgi:hypothetical protein